MDAEINKQRYQPYLNEYNRTIRNYRTRAYKYKLPLPTREQLKEDRNFIKGYIVNNINFDYDINTEHDFDLNESIAEYSVNDYADMLDEEIYFHRKGYNIDKFTTFIEYIMKRVEDAFSIEP